MAPADARAYTAPHGRNGYYVSEYWQGRSLADNRRNEFFFVRVAVGKERKEKKEILTNQLWRPQQSNWFGSSSGKLWRLKMRHIPSSAKASYCVFSRDFGKFDDSATVDNTATGPSTAGENVLLDTYY